MQEFFREHPRTQWAVIVLCCFIVAIVILRALFDWNLLRGPLARTITRETGRITTIDGDIRVHPWSFQPSVQIGGLKIDNPDWAGRKVMFAARDIIVSVDLGRLLLGQVVLPLVELDGPEINLERDAKSRASWELATKSGAPHHDTTPVKLPAINRLIIENGKLHVTDEIRKLTFSGSLTAGARNGEEESSALKIRATGTLNAKPFRLDAAGGPLQDLTPTKPYSFSARLTASDINLDADVTVRKPFDLNALDVKFVVSGADLADVFYLTGLALPNTPKYKLAATLHVNGRTVEIPDLHGSLGTSDLSGTMRIETQGNKPKLTAHLSSKLLNLADLAPLLGQRVPPPNRLSLDNASGGKTRTADAKPAPPPAPNTPAAEPNDGLLLPDADLQVNRVRGMNADVTYRAESVKVPKIPMTSFDLHVTLADGLLTIDPLNFNLSQGKLTGVVQIDARQDDPTSDVDFHIHNVNLDEFKSTAMKQAPLGGVLLGRIKFQGTGTSVHKFAASSNGAMSVVIPEGNINEAIAELTGINVLQGLGLLITKEQKQTDIRCGIMDFKDHDGTLNTTTVYVDTSNVLITGRGDINLGDEDIKLALQGDPKHIRLIRLRSPIVVAGTLLHPTIGLSAGKLAQQAAIAAALGTLLTPAAAALAFIDPGLAKNKDCSTVLAQAQAGVQNP